SCLKLRKLSHQFSFGLCPCKIVRTVQILLKNVIFFNECSYSSHSYEKITEGFSSIFLRTLSLLNCENRSNFAYEFNIFQLILLLVSFSSYNYSMFLINFSENL